MELVMANKPLRLAILTTETINHCYFVKALAKCYPNVMVFQEDRSVSATFLLNHDSEGLRDQYELDSWFDGKKPKLTDFAPVKCYSDLNDPACVESLKEFAPDTMVVFGTGRLDHDVVSICPEKIVTLYAADPEQYRGLDTHLWAVYHNDFRSLVTTLHKVTHELERGGVVMKRPIPLHKDMGLWQLRKASTELCADITLQGLEMLETYGQYISQPQLYIGRHYSFMPAVLKDRCDANFLRYTSNLPE
jgi:hypothetical protein